MSKKVILTFPAWAGRTVSLMLLFAIILPPAAIADSADEILSNESILSLLKMKASPGEIVGIIERNLTNFDLSASGIAKLNGDGVNSDVLEAMWRATLKASKTASAPAAGQKPRAMARELTQAQQAADRTDSKNELGPTSPATCDKVKLHSEDRLSQAKRVQADPTSGDYPHLPAYDEGCPLTEDESVKGNPTGRPFYRVRCDWKTGSITTSRVDHSGKYCFEVERVNNILYSYDFTLTRSEPQGSDFDLLKDVISKVKDLGAGTAVTGPGKAAFATKLHCGLEHLTLATKAAAALQDALSQLDPAKDSGAKPNSIPLEITLAKWQGVPGKFQDFEKELKDLIAELIAAPPVNGTTCTECDLAQAEALVLDVYLPARDHYLKLRSRANSQHVARYSADIESTSAYDLVVKELSGNQPTSADSKTFHLDPGRKILVSSAGFLLTSLQARTYLSRTVPDTDDPTNTKIKNVLGVDGGGKARVAMTALLNYNLPWQPWRNLGFAISAGPVFDITNGKADTSRFGFFGGGSVHLWNRLFLTPGVHFGEFADFPQGFDHSGQPIPEKTGTPTPTKRWTARFAFGITFRVGELGFGSGNTSNDTSKKTPSSQPKSGSQ